MGVRRCDGNVADVCRAIRISTAVLAACLQANVVVWNKNQSR